MQIGKTIYLSNRKDWREWLKKNHKTEPDIWLIYYKKATGKPTIKYEEAVEEALCFGWIDGIEKSIDEESYAGRFSPRRKDSNFSESNKVRVEKLIKEGKMTKAGFNAIVHAFKPS